MIIAAGDTGNFAGDGMTLDDHDSPLPRRSLHDLLVGRLRQMIIDGRLVPGERVAELDLCRTFDVSRTPLREALKVLAAEGLVELLPNRGARIVERTAADLKDLFDVMGALEGLAGEQACANASDGDIATIRDLHYRMVTCYGAGDLPGYFRLNQQIHQAILEAAGNTALTRLHASIAGQILASRYSANLSGERWRQAVEEHAAMLDLLQARRGAELGELLRRHMSKKWDAVRLAMQEAEAEETRRTG